MEENIKQEEKSKTILEGTPKEREAKRQEILDYLAYGEADRLERKRVTEVRRDFFEGNQGKYTNITGLVKKERKGHVNAVINYAGMTAIKLYYAIGNNPPKPTITPIDVTDDVEVTNTQMVENFCDRVMFINRFWKRGYKRGAMNQGVLGDFSIKVYYDSKDKTIKVINVEKPENLIVIWRGDDLQETIAVAHKELVSIKAIENEFGYKVIKADVTPDTAKGDVSQGSHEPGFEYTTKTSDQTGRGNVPDVKLTSPSSWVVDYWDEDYNVVLIGEKIVQYVKHDWGFNPYTIGHNIHNPGKPWSFSDIDFLIDPNVELNEVSNDERDFIRVGANTKFIARNMNDFDPESLKPGSGQVIFVEGPDSNFETLPVQVNTFPADSYATRMKKHIHDMGIPEVTYGGATGNSGRAKAIDYQSMLDKTDDKRDAWELVLQEVYRKIQILGQKYFPSEFWLNSQGEPEVRQVDFDWSDIVPITQSERIVDVVNKVQGIGLPIKTALAELGYKDVDAQMELIKKEAQDPEIAPIKAKMWNLTPGIMEAQQEALQQTPSPSVNESGPTLTPGENQGRERSLPMAVAGGQTSFSSPKGFIERSQQNLRAKQGG
jgi:hypothetical protein